MFKLLAAGFIGYYIGKRSLPKAVEDVKALSAEVEEFLTRIEETQLPPDMSKPYIS